jgi:diphosphomevalonate decarboxylase
MNLGNLTTRTSIILNPSYRTDKLVINGVETSGETLNRVNRFMDQVREISTLDYYAEIISENNFPSGAGIASSASGFAALSLAAAEAFGLEYSERELSRLARLGSGSASRSIPTGFVECFTGDTDEDAYAEGFAGPEHWNLVDLIAVISAEHKQTGSTEGHKLANTSVFQKARVANTPDRLKRCKKAILERDFSTFAEVVELDTILMHAVMMTSVPQLFYWEPGTLRIIKAVRKLRADGLEACYTIDAGANVHVICTEKSRVEVHEALSELNEVKDFLVSEPGGPAKLISA